MIENILNEKLKNIYPSFEGIYFFGSQRRGDANQFSDYDLVFSFSSEVNQKLKNEVYKIVYEYEVNNYIIIDCHIYSHSQIKNPNTPFKKNVKAEGIFYGI